MIDIGEIHIISKQDYEKFKNKATKENDIQWISVFEKLPEVKEKVLVAMQVGDIPSHDEEDKYLQFQVDIGRFCMGLIYRGGGNVKCARCSSLASFRTSLDYIPIPGQFRHVVAWAPLPKKYEEVSIND